MKSCVYAVRRKKLVSMAGEITTVDMEYEVDAAIDLESLASVIRQDPNLIEVRPREILEVTVSEEFITVEQAVKHLVFVESDVPDDMPIGLHYELLHELLGDDADTMCLYQEEWNRVTESVLRRAVFVNGRPFLAIRDRFGSEVHFVESEPIAIHERPTPKFTPLVSIGFTEENSMVSGYDGQEVGLLADDVGILVTRPDEGEIDYAVFRQEPDRQSNMILELMASQFHEFMAKIMVEALIGRIPEKFVNEVPAAWVEDEGSWSAITSIELSPLLTLENPRSPIRQGILDWLLDFRRGENFEAWLAEYIASVVDPNSPDYEKRIARHARVEVELSKWE